MFFYLSVSHELNWMTKHSMSVNFNCVTFYLTSSDFSLSPTSQKAIFIFQIVLITRGQLIPASNWTVKDNVTFHSEVCVKSEVTGTLLCHSVTFQAILTSRNTDFCALDSNNPSLSLCEISSFPALMIIMVFLSELQTSDWPQLLHEPEASNHPIYARWNV